ncbi:MAG: sensor histidine kinase [Gammaproteobacteria bacterium]|nr:sensor histidine kinase [Gammaproteobacteria bacterium]
MQSLERRLGIGLAVILGIAFSLILLASVAAIRSLSEAYAVTRLEHDAEALAGTVAPSPRGSARMREGRISPIYRQPLSGHYFTVRFDSGTDLRSRSLWDEVLEFDTLAPGEIVLSRQRGPGDQELLVRTAGYQRGEQRFTLVVAEDLAPLARQIRQFQWSAALLLLTALVGALLVQRVVLRRAFGSLDTLRSEIHEVSAGTREHLETLGPREVRPLTSEINRLLLQLQQRLRRSRESLANLAHALKAPLARLLQDVDTLAIDSQTHTRLQRDLRQISVLVDHELRRGRLAGNSVGQYFVPARDIPELVAAMQQLYRDRALQIQVGTLASTAVAIDRQDLVELLGNLLDNACKHARTRVQLDVDVDTALQLRVADDGPGIPASELDSLPARGKRLDERAGGHGLGLSIVQDIVNDHRGALRLARCDVLGGLAVEVSLPLPAAPD